MATSRSNKVRLYIPSKDRYGNRVSNRKVRAGAEQLFVHCFTGCTRLQGIGTYRSDADELVQEKIEIIESNATDEELQTHLPALRAFAQKMKMVLNQEAVSLEIHGVLEFV